MHYVSVLPISSCSKTSCLALEQAVMTELRPIASISTVEMLLWWSKDRLDVQECPLSHAASRAFPTMPWFTPGSFRCADSAALHRLKRLAESICTTIAGAPNESRTAYVCPIMLSEAFQALPSSNADMQAFIVTASGRTLLAFICPRRSAANAHSVSLMAPMATV